MPWPLLRVVTLSNNQQRNSGHNVKNIGSPDKGSDTKISLTLQEPSSYKRPQNYVGAHDSILRAWRHKIESTVKYQTTSPSYESSVHNYSPICNGHFTKPTILRTLRTSRQFF